MFTLINRTGNRNSVYQIGRKGSNVIVQFGTLGSKRKVSIKRLKNVREARAFLTEKWNDKVDSGYVHYDAMEWYALKRETATPSVA